MHFKDFQASNHE